MEFPDVELEAHTGGRVSPARVPKAVVYFFPKAFTQGCTRETIRFNELYPRFREKGYEVFGVSTDGVETSEEVRGEAQGPVQASERQGGEARRAARDLAADGHGGAGDVRAQRRRK
jgi:peroxiredoxin